MTKEQIEELIDSLERDPELKMRLGRVLSSPPAAVDGRFEAILAEIRDLRADWQKRWEEQRADWQKQWAEQREDWENRWHEQRAEIREFRADIQKLGQRVVESTERNRVALVGIVGGYRFRVGHLLEDAVAGLLRVVLGPTGLRAQDVQVRQKWRDEDGEHEVDLVVRDDVQYVIEVTWDLADLREKNLPALARKMDGAIRHWRLSAARKVLVAVDKDPDLAAECGRLGIALV